MTQSYTHLQIPSLTHTYTHTDILIKEYKMRAQWLLKTSYLCACLKSVDNTLTVTSQD